ncbi:uncharacterized protein LOC124918266, partial [Impatiens glandulifera]|uniref:uncharacterized protein LOC124918266 n=1 Tax=Impatiens glandulifera TaxID=253017 RepID=UPI001FB067A5
MSSLHRLLTDEGFERGNSHTKKTKQVRFKDRTENDSIVLPIHICHSRRSFDNTSRPKLRNVKGSSVSVTNSSKRPPGSDSGKSKNSLSCSRMDEPSMDEVATRAVISILSGYAGKFSKDSCFRETVREKCYYLCFARNGISSDSNNGGILTSLELGMKSAEKLLICPQGMWTDTFTNSIRLLTVVVASLNSNAKGSSSSSTRGTPNSHLSACAQLYLSIVYKMEKNDVMSAKHLLQVFCDDPFLARTHLLPELWEHFFLPHLLHLKIWYGNEVESLSGLYNDKDKTMKSLKKLYNGQMDKGTTLFALYYKEWLSVGPQRAPPAPSVPLPSKRSYVSSRRGSLDSSATHSSISKSLYQTVFGHNLDPPSSEFDEMNRRAMNEWDLETEKKASENHRTPNHRRHSKSELKAETRKTEHHTRLFPCQSVPAETVSSSSSTRRTRNTHLIPGDVANAISTICSSNNLSECEISIRLIIKAWLNNNLKGNSTLENAISKVPVIE